MENPNPNQPPQGEPGMPPQGVEHSLLQQWEQRDPPEARLQELRASNSPLPGYLNKRFRIGGRPPAAYATYLQSALLIMDAVQPTTSAETVNYAEIIRDYNKDLAIFGEELSSNMIKKMSEFLPEHVSDQLRKIQETLRGDKELAFFEGVKDMYPIMIMARMKAKASSPNFATSKEMSAILEVFGVQGLPKEPREIPNYTPESIKKVLGDAVTAEDLAFIQTGLDGMKDFINLPRYVDHFSSNDPERPDDDTDARDQWRFRMLHRLGHPFDVAYTYKTQFRANRFHNALQAIELITGVIATNMPGKEELLEQLETVRQELLNSHRGNNPVTKKMVKSPNPMPRWLLRKNRQY